MTRPPPRRVAVLGARMADVQALQQALRGQPGVRLVELPQADVALLLGLPGQAGALATGAFQCPRARTAVAGGPLQQPCIAVRVGDARDEASTAG